MVHEIDIVSNVKENQFCEACTKGKQYRSPYPKSADYRATEPSRYYVTFIDDYSRYTSVYFLKNNSEVLEKFKEFHTYAANITGKRVKILRSDNGGEYTSKEFESYLKKNGIVHQLSVPYNPAQNGVTERMNRTIKELT